MGAPMAIMAAGQIYSAMAQKQAADYNAKVYEAEAAAETQKSASEEAVHREKVKSLISSQRAKYGMSGVAMTGSPLDVISETAGKGELDALAIRYGGEVAAAAANSKAAASRSQGQTALLTGALGLGSTLLAGKK